MSSINRTLKRSGLPVLLVLCLAALSVSYAFADEAARPRALQIIGDPDAAVNGRFAVGTASVGSKALTVVGVIDFLGIGTVHNYFTQGTGNNMQINTNVDESNVVGDASRSQWKLVLGSSLDWFSIRRSPAGGTYNEDALFFIEGSTGNVGIATVDTGNLAAIPFTFQARLHVQTTSGQAILGRTSASSGAGVYGHATATSGSAWGVWGQSDSNSGAGVFGQTLATAGSTAGLAGLSRSVSGIGVLGTADASTGETYGVRGVSYSPDGTGVYGLASATTGYSHGVLGETDSHSGYGVFGIATATSGTTYGVYGQSDSTSGRAVYGYATATTGSNTAVYGRSDSAAGYGVAGWAAATTGSNYGVLGETDSNSGYGVFGIATATSGTTYGVYGQSDSASGRAVYGYATATSGINYGVSGETDSGSGYGVFGRGYIGVYGRNNDTTMVGFGVFGRAFGTSAPNYGVVGESESMSGIGVYGFALSPTGVNYGVYGKTNSTSGYGVYFDGGLAGTGTKSAIVETQDYGWRHLYAMESPRNWFEDFGQATLVAGEAVVPIEPIFAQTVSLADGYHVFLTPLGDCPLYVAEKSASSFTVRAHEGASCEIAFDYRIIAPRLDYEDLRLEPAEDPEAVAASLPALE